MYELGRTTWKDGAGAITLRKVVSLTQLRRQEERRLLVRSMTSRSNLLHKVTYYKPLVAKFKFSTKVNPN